MGSTLNDAAPENTIVLRPKAIYFKQNLAFEYK